MVSKDRIGIIFVWGAALVPLLLWLLAPPPPPRPAAGHAVMVRLGQGSGLVGMALFSLSFVLATRAAPAVPRNRRPTPQ